MKKNAKKSEKSYSKNLHNSNIVYTFAAKTIITLITDRRAAKVTKNMAINIIEFHHNEQEYLSTSFSNYADAQKGLKKQMKSWKELADEMPAIQTNIIKHTPYCYSLYQDGEIKLTWEIIVIPE